MKIARPLKQAFVATVAAAGAGVFGGCDNHTITNPPPPEENCPLAQPSIGDPCSDAGLSCAYGPRCEQTRLTCQDQQWTLKPQIETVVDPACVCPEGAPVAGAQCEGIGLTCTYDDGGCPVDFACAEDGRWDSWESTCNPPPPCPTELPVAATACELTPGGYPVDCSYPVETPCGSALAAAACVESPGGGALWEVTFDPSCQASPEDCSGYAQAGACAADPGCQWLVPGCAEGGTTPAAVEGCYAAGDCSQTGCGSWGACETVVHNPCWNDPCDACGAEVDVCVPLDAG